MIMTQYIFTSAELFDKRILLSQDLMVGDEASKLRSMLEISYPMQNGIVRYVLCIRRLCTRVVYMHQM